MASETETPLEFTVTSGTHRGATFALKDDLLLIGADASCDVWLSDPGLASRHVAVMADGRTIAIRPLDGPVSVNGQALASATRTVVAPGSEITLGETGVRLQLGGVSPGEGAVEKGSDRLQAATPTVAKGRSRTIAATLLVAGALLVLGFTTQQLRPSHAATAQAASVSADAVLSEAELVAQIRDVFRSNGYAAEVTHLNGASVRIENLDASHERVKRAAANVRADIPQLKSLSFASYDTAEPPNEPPLYDDAPTDHMSLHVDSGTAYLAARDGRYFVGSMLPNGDTIRRITPHAVLVDRDGQFTWFRF